MKKFLTRSLLLVLALSMTVSSVALLAGCNDNEKPSETPSDDTVKSDILDGLPDTEYNQDFIIVCRDQGEEFFRETSEGDRIDYAIYIRNTTIEDKYGIKIKYTNFSYNNIPSWVSNIVKAGDEKSVDIVLNHVVYSTHIALANNAENWNEVPYVDLSKDWWADSNLEDLTLNGKTFVAIGDMCTTAIGSVWCMFYNKELCKRYGIDNLYNEIMVDKSWTFNKMMSYIKDIREDANRDGEYTELDLYGLTTPGGSAANAYLWAFDNPIFKKNENTGELEYCFYTDKLPRILDMLINRLYYKVNGVHFSNSGDTSVKMFINNRALFMNNILSTAKEEMRDMDTSLWGIAPYPKFNNSQEEYLSSVDGGHNALIAVRVSQENEVKREKIGVITEAFNRLSHEGLRIEYYDVALKSKYLGDPQEANVIDMIMDNLVFDFGYIYLQFGSPAFWIQDMVAGKNDMIASYYEHKKNDLQSNIENAYEAFGLTFAGIE